MCSRFLLIVVSWLLPFQLFAQGWITNETVDAMDDSKTIVITKIADTGVGTYGDPISLSIMCRDGKTVALLNWHTFMDTEAVRVTARLDKEEASTVSWSISNDHESTFARNAEDYARSLLGKEKAIFRATPYGENPITVTFSLAGLEAAVQPIEEACEWGRIPEPLLPPDVSGWTRAQALESAFDSCDVRADERCYSNVVDCQLYYKDVANFTNCSYNGALR